MATFVKRGEAWQAKVRRKGYRRGAFVERTR